jgi:hypothetical protein
MIPFKPAATLPSHEVENMPPHISNQDLCHGDRTCEAM